MRIDRNSIQILACVLFVAVCGVCLATVFAADPPPAPAASTYAPTEDLIGQIDYYIKHLDEVLENKAEFDDAAITRIKKDGNTITALALVLGMHDARNKLKPVAPALIKASQELAKAKDFDAATAAMAAVKSAMEGKGDAGGDALKWGRVASMSQLMKQVPSVNSALKRGLTPQRFKQLQTQSAGQSATLAAIAQAVMADTHEVKNPAEIDKWYQYCAEMRDAAGAVNAAIHANDQAATAGGMSRLAQSCESCHAVFRKEAK
jgi:cytochrome c556